MGLHLVVSSVETVIGGHLGLDLVCYVYQSGKPWRPVWGSGCRRELLTGGDGFCLELRVGGRAFKAGGDDNKANECHCQHKATTEKTRALRPSDITLRVPDGWGRSRCFKPSVISGEDGREWANGFVRVMTLPVRARASSPFEWLLRVVLRASSRS